ncbi:hypothetical protein ACB092_11G193900 [Castanea dentata]
MAKDILEGWLQYIQVPCNHLVFTFIQIYPYYKLVKCLCILLYASFLLKKLLLELFLHLLPTLNLDFTTSLARNLQLFPPRKSSPFKVNSD